MRFPPLCCSCLCSGLIFVSILHSILSQDVEDNGLIFVTPKMDAFSGGGTTANEIPIFPSSTVMSTSRHRDHDDDTTTTTNLKKKRILKFLRNFRLDFSKFDTTCVKREGRGLTAPAVSHARVVKYTRRRNRSRDRNYYVMALYECLEGYDFPLESSDRMFCSRNKWVGPTPVCLAKGTLDESDCIKCDQICSHGSEGDNKSGVVCSCYSGYEMTSSSTCVDINECLTDNGGCTGICFNQPGSFQCYCPAGHQVGPDGKTCIDRNECLLRNGHGPCQDGCENTPGSYTCSCERTPGTKLGSDKHSCEDINECDTNNFNCSHGCLNTFGTAFCTCPKGFALSAENYKTCISEEIPEPTTQPPLPPREEEDQPPENLELLNTLVADCPPGSALDSENSLICVEHADCSVENGGCDHICIDTSDSYRVCSCRKGYELVNGTACRDVNECDTENGGCDQDCTNIPGTFFCSCKPGYVLKEDKRICEPEFCQDPPLLVNASGWECEHHDTLRTTTLSTDGYFRSGTKCRVNCLPGFSLTLLNEIETTIFGKQVKSLGGSNSKYVTCSGDGTWSPADYEETVACTASSCPALSKPEFGTLFPEICSSSDRIQLNTQCLVLCEVGYYPKNGRLRTCSKGYRWSPEDSTVCIRLPATPRPYIHCPSDVKVDLMPGMASAYVKIPQPQANMDWYRYVEADPTWAKNLEWEVPAGYTQVTFTARSPVSNDTAACRFKIHVIDLEAPRVQGCPTSFEVRLNPGETSREMWWSEPKFTDNVKLHYVQQSHNPGLLMTDGTTHINYVAGDAEGNKARCSFSITVHGPEEYEMADYSYYTGTNNYHRHMIICPNLKTGRWTVHYAYYLPPGCRYSTSRGIFSKFFKQSSSSSSSSNRNRRRILPPPPTPSSSLSPSHENPWRHGTRNSNKLLEKAELLLWNQNHHDEEKEDTQRRRRN
ncbi:uncharacterized protein LOC118433481 [Folsomia candida]|uniref:uncharacterized protein LOC118433481 n=1 Tax=Folsomia candida TaxID=158441 RepID=UPI001604B2AD|nr:uncharacterized protein LOC118433481 [Folsomia candida]